MDTTINDWRDRMNDKDKAQWLSDRWAEVAQGGVWECYWGQEWHVSTAGATAGSDPKKWRVVLPPVLKKIALTTLIGSGLDCEFWQKCSEYKHVGPLLSVDECFAPYMTDVDAFEHCQPRMSPYVHYWAGGNVCPVPEGFEMRLHLREGESWISGATRWIHTGQGGDIIGIEVISIKDGYTLGGGE